MRPWFYKLSDLFFEHFKQIFDLNTHTHTHTARTLISDISVQQISQHLIIAASLGQLRTVKSSVMLNATKYLAHFVCKKNKTKRQRKDYWESVKVGLFSSFQHKPFLTEKTASLASEESRTVHTFIVLSNLMSTMPLKRYAVSTITPSPFFIVQKQIAGQIKAEDGRVDCSLQQPKLARGALKSSVSSTPSDGIRFILSLLIKKEIRGAGASSIGDCLLMRRLIPALSFTFSSDAWQGGWATAPQMAIWQQRPNSWEKCQKATRKVSEQTQ